MNKQDKNLLSLKPKQILEMDNSVKYHWAKELGYSGTANTSSKMRAIEQYILDARKEAQLRNRGEK